MLQTWRTRYSVILKISNTSVPCDQFWNLNRLNSSVLNGTRSGHACNNFGQVYEHNISSRGHNTYLRRSCMSGPGYRISTADACPGVEKMLRQSTKSPKLSPNRSRPSPAYSYSTNSWKKKKKEKSPNKSGPGRA